LEDLLKNMRFVLLSNNLGKITIIHEKQLDFSVAWLEYTLSDENIYIVFENGKSQCLGLKINPAMKSNLSKAESITLAYAPDGKIQNSLSHTLIVKDY